MTPDVFRRLALVAGCSAWATAIALVWILIGWPAAIFAALAGPGGAYALSLEPAPEEPDVDVVEEPAGLGHRDIARKARAARGDDDD